MDEARAFSLYNNLSHLSQILVGIDYSTEAISLLCQDLESAIKCNDLLKLTKQYLDDNTKRRVLGNVYGNLYDFLYQDYSMHITNKQASVMMVCVYSLNFQTIQDYRLSLVLERMSALHFDESFTFGILKNSLGPDIKFSKKWKTSTTIALARTIYDNRDYSTMPILADALQDAGFDHEMTLNRLRSSDVFGNSDWVLVNLIDFKNKKIGRTSRKVSQ